MNPPTFAPAPQLVSAKTANGKQESDLKQERANLLDLQKMLYDERKLMASMEVEHQQRLVELELRHQEKVSVVAATVTFGQGRVYPRPTSFDFFFFF